MNSKMMDIHADVQRALDTGKPVVALESTIITHGMPYPDNDRMAASVESIIRANGAVPACVAVIDGRIKVGLSAEDRNALAQMKGLRKLSRADFAFAVAEKVSGGTTVAATMMAAAAVGIKVFATGGIGGVHKGAETSFDISADLLELAQTSVIVVAAGAKAILDIPKTMEVLETQGVPVVGYQTDVLPAFWSRTSDIKAPIRLDSAEAIARFQSTRDALNVRGGMLVANPIPAAHEIPAAEMAGYIKTAQDEADARKVSGKEVTPFLLAKIVEITRGRSLASNIALVENNAKLAAEIAVALTGC